MHTLNPRYLIVLHLYAIVRPSARQRPFYYCTSCYMVKGVLCTGQCDRCGACSALQA